MNLTVDMNTEQYIGNSDITMVEAMKRIDKNASGILLIVDDGQLVGAVSDGDIRRWLIQTGNLDAKISQVMNVNPKYVYEQEESSARDVLERQQIDLIPVVDEHLHVVKIIRTAKFGDDDPANEILKELPLVIMAGGKGTRLYPYTKIIPKPLIPINDIPIVERIIGEFQKYKINNIYMTVNYKKEMIKSYFNESEYDYSINYIEEDMPLGTAGSLSLLPDIEQDNIIITNCDILIRTNYSDIYKAHVESGNDMTVVSAVVKTTIPYGVIHSEDGYIKAIDEKPSLNHVVNTGMYIIKSEHLSRIPSNTVYNMTDLMSDMITSGYKVGMYPVGEESFLDMGEFVEMQHMENELKNELH